jgi:DNA-binding response OmpR family regulator
MSATIFIVDDEPFMLRLIEASLKKGGYRIEPFRDAEAAISAAIENPPKLFVFDLIMPGMDGIAALRRIREIPAFAEVPAILLTSKGHQFSQQQAKECGAALYLTKPFSPTELLNEVRRLIGPA